MRGHTVAALALAVVIAGCSGAPLGDSAGADPSDVTPAPIPSERRTTAGQTDGAPFPPGVSPTGLDVEELATAHAAVARNASYTLRVTQSRPATERPNDRLLTVVRQESPSRYRAATYVTDPDSTGSPIVVADVYVVNGTASWVFYGERARNDSLLDSPGDERYADFVPRLLERYLSVGTVSLTRTTRDGEPVVELFGTAPVGEFGDASDYRVEAVVGLDGFVHSFSASYRRSGEQVTAEVQYEDVGETTVTKPGWLGGTDGGSNGGSDGESEAEADADS